MARFTCVMSLVGALLPWVALQAEAPPLPKRLATVSSGLRYDIVLGRLRAVPLQPGLTQNCSLETEATKTTERLAVSPGEAGVGIRYDLSSPSEDFTFETIADGRWLVRREPRGEATWPRCELNQPVSGAITLTIGEKKCSAPTIWHLLLDQRTLCREHLAPLLEAIQPGWQVDWQADRLAAALAVRKPEELVPAAEVEKLVAKLAESKFAVRRAATAELEKLGPRCLLVYSSMNPQRLEKQQRTTLEYIQARMAAEGADTPERTAAWLQADPNIWTMLAKEGRPEQQAAALLRLRAATNAATIADPQFTASP